MKQAILITAYKDEPALVRLLRHFSDGDAVNHFRIFVHIDRKSRDLNPAKIKALNIPNVTVISKYTICWGSIRHIYAVLDLMRIMLTHNDISYVHVISGTDIAVQTPEWFVAKFENDKTTRFNPGALRMLDRGEKYKWYCRYWLPTTWNHRNKIVALLNIWLNAFQGLLHTKRRHIGTIPCERLFFSHIWASYSKEACNRVVSFADNNQDFLHGINFTEVPEEVFFATALSNSEYMVKNGTPYLRYSYWGANRGQPPAVLDERDYPAIVAGEYAFARKIDSVKSKKLIDLIDAKLTASVASKLQQNKTPI